MIFIRWCLKQRVLRKNICVNLATNYLPHNGISYRYLFRRQIRFIYPGYVIIIYYARGEQDVCQNSSLSKQWRQPIFALDEYVHAILSFSFAYISILNYNNHPLESTQPHTSRRLRNILFHMRLN